MTKPRTYTKEQLIERALISAMKDMPLKPGQMLLLGPKSVRALTVKGQFNGQLPDKLIIEKSEWNAT